MLFCNLPFWLQVEVVACGISWSVLERAWNLQGSSTKKPHNLGVPFFGLSAFRWCYTFMKSHLQWFFQNFQEKSGNFHGVFTEAFLQPPTCFFQEQTTDRQIDLLFWVLRHPAHCTSLELLPEPSQNKICLRLCLK